MKVPVDAGKAIYTVGNAPRPKMRYGGKEGQPAQQEADKATGELLFQTQLMVTPLNDEDGYTIVVTTAGEPQKITKGQQVVPVELVATPWEQERNGKLRWGVAFRAKALQPAKNAPQSQAA